MYGSCLGSTTDMSADEIKIGDDLAAATICACDPAVEQVLASPPPVDVYAIHPELLDQVAAGMAETVEIPLPPFGFVQAPIPDPRSPVTKPLGCRTVRIRDQYKHHDRGTALALSLAKDLCDLAGIGVGDYVQLTAYADGMLTVKRVGEGL
jgi:hypothetical protein